MKFLHSSLNPVHSGCKPSTFMPFSTHSLHVVFPSTSSRPCHLYLSTGLYPILHTLTIKMPKSPQSATPHHLRHTLYSVHPEDCTNPHCVSYPPATPRTSISSSVPSSPNYCFAFFFAQVLVPYINALWTQALYIFPFMRYMMQLELSG